MTRGFSSRCAIPWVIVYFLMVPRKYIYIYVERPEIIFSLLLQENKITKFLQENWCTANSSIARGIHTHRALFFWYQQRKQVFFFFFSKTLNNDGASSEVLKVSDKLGLLLLIGMVLFNSVWTGVPGGFWPRPAQYYRVCDPLSGRDFFTTCRSCTNPQTEKQALFFRFERYDRPNYFSK